jgi:hypothetical protein
VAEIIKLKKINFYQAKDFYNGFSNIMKFFCFGHYYFKKLLKKKNQLLKK